MSFFCQWSMAHPTTESSGSATLAQGTYTKSATTSRSAEHATIYGSYTLSIQTAILRVATFGVGSLSTRVTPMQFCVRSRNKASIPSLSLRGLSWRGFSPQNTECGRNGQRELIELISSSKGMIVALQSSATESAIALKSGSRESNGARL